MSWTPERVELLKSLWCQGHSASRIATVFGDVSRNAVIGKAHRLGLSGKARIEAGEAAAGSPGGEGHASANRRETAASGNPPRRRKAKARPKRLLNILALNDSSCKFPIGDPGAEGFHFCGNPVIGNGPYCERHRAIAYQPGTDRRRVRRAVIDGAAPAHNMSENRRPSGKEASA